MCIHVDNIDGDDSSVEAIRSSSCQWRLILSFHGVDNVEVFATVSDRLLLGKFSSAVSVPPMRGWLDAGAASFDHLETLSYALN